MFAVLTSLAVLACSQSTLAAGSLPNGVSPGGNSSSQSITLSGGDEREYLIHIPKDYDEGTPTGLIYAFAGRGSDNAHTESFTKFSNPSYNPDMIVVYPQGTIDNRGQDVWEGDPNADVDDIGFTMELLDELIETYNIDENRIYASGMSNGGGFVANHLACDKNASERFAAFGAVSAAYYQFKDASRRACDAESVKISCKNGGNKVALLDIHGGDDDTIPYEGGYRRRACLPSIPHFITSWAKRNGMDTTNDTEEVYNGRATHYSFGGNESAGMVQSYFVPTLGHLWASGANGEVVNATDLLMDFFNEWTLDVRDTAAESLPDSSASANLRASSLLLASCITAASVLFHIL
ncbi:hypothetical protein Q7P37_008789 [Cladosporium fusiforme]